MCLITTSYGGNLSAMNMTGLKYCMRTISTIPPQRLHQALRGVGKQHDLTLQAGNQSVPKVYRANDCLSEGSVALHKNVKITGSGYWQPFQACILLGNI